MCKAKNFSNSVRISNALLLMSLKCSQEAPMHPVHMKRTKLPFWLRESIDLSQPYARGAHVHNDSAVSSCHAKDKPVLESESRDIHKKHQHLYQILKEWSESKQRRHTQWCHRDPRNALARGWAENQWWHDSFYTSKTVHNLFCGEIL